MRLEEVEGDAKCATIYNFKGNIIKLPHLLPLFFKNNVEDDEDDDNNMAPEIKV